MTRVKKGMNALKTRKNVLKKTKGYLLGRRSKERQAYEAIYHAGTYAFAHRRDKKNDYRKLWQVRINAALRPLGHSYSKWIGTAIKKNVLIDRKILSELAADRPETFARVVKFVA